MNPTPYQALPVNSFRRDIRARKLLIGCWQSFNSPITAENRTAARPASHNSASPASGAPFTGSWPVQFGTAVSRKPAITASA